VNVGIILSAHPHGTTHQPWDDFCEILDSGFYLILLKKLCLVKAEAGNIPFT
jgi:hypothetical protein